MTDVAWTARWYPNAAACSADLWAVEAIVVVCHLCAGQHAVKGDAIAWAEQHRAEHLPVMDDAAPEPRSLLETHHPDLRLLWEQADPEARWQLLTTLYDAEGHADLPTGWALVAVWIESRTVA